MNLIKLFTLLEEQYPCGDKGRHSITTHGNPDEIFLDIWVNGTMQFFQLEDISELDKPEKLLADINGMLNENV